MKSKRDILINTLFRQQKLKEEGVRIERNGENCMEIALRAIKKKKLFGNIFEKVQGREDEVAFVTKYLENVNLNIIGNEVNC